MTILFSGSVLTFSDGSTLTTNPMPSGSNVLFQQTTAPTGWTKVTTYTNHAVRIVAGTASTGGSVAFTSAFTSQSVTGTNSGGAVTATTLSTAQLASHSHQYNLYTGYNPVGPSLYQFACLSTGPSSQPSTCGSGGGASHTHGFTQPTFTGTAINLAVQYVDIIIATKN